MFFDRFTDAGSPSGPLTRQSEEEVAQEVANSVEVLLNTRRTNSGSGNTGSLSYGIPDFLNLSLTSEDHVKQVEKIMSDAIREFEPRMGNPKVTISRDSRRGQVNEVKIDGNLRLPDGKREVTFHVFVPCADPGQRRRHMTI